MILGVGVDLVEIDRIERALDRWGNRFVAKLMDAQEATALPAAAPDRARALALAIAAKEAASKAIGTGWSRGVRWRDVVVQLEPVPCVRLLNRAALIARVRGSGGATRTRFEIRKNLVIGEVRLLA